MILNNVQESSARWSELGTIASFFVQMWGGALGALAGAVAGAFPGAFAGTFAGAFVGAAALVVEDVEGFPMRSRAEPFQSSCLEPRPSLLRLPRASQRASAAPSRKPLRERRPLVPSPVQLPFQTVKGAKRKRRGSEEEQGGHEKEPKRMRRERDAMGKRRRSEQEATGERKRRGSEGEANGDAMGKRRFKMAGPALLSR